uniref:Uncharacterized protein n=1 Tax=Anguilla anguilla TaxID=7936 RepID=A0A0E9QV34_ANGAN
MLTQTALGVLSEILISRQQHGCYEIHNKLLSFRRKLSL